MQLKTEEYMGHRIEFFTNYPRPGVTAHLYSRERNKAVKDSSHPNHMIWGYGGVISREQTKEEALLIVKKQIEKLHEIQRTPVKIEWINNR